MAFDVYFDLPSESIINVWLFSLLEFKGIFRYHNRDNALNFHKIRDFCILVMIVDI